MIDDFIGMLPIVLTIALSEQDALQRFGADRTLLNALWALAAYGWYLAYFTVLEGRWGAGLGKSLCGLRVAGPDGAAPGFGRALGRASIYLGASIFLLFFEIAFIPELEFARRLAEGAFFWSDALAIPMWLALFVTMRRRNGFAALHDLLTGTRVVLRPAAAARPRLAEALPSPEISSSASEAGLARVGPYQLLAWQWEKSGEKLALGFDDVLRRKIWAHYPPAGSPPVSARRRDVSRPGRLRWLNGKRSGQEAWDVYEALEGKSLLATAQTPQPWRAVRFWLNDLAAELVTQFRDESQIRAGLHRVWLTADGRAVLLDFDAPNLPGAQSRPLAALNSFKDIQAFLAEVAQTALGRGESLTGGDLPLHARPFLKSLQHASLQSPDALLGNLQSLLNRTAEISLRKRLGAALFPPAIGAVLAALCMVGIFVETNRWDKEWTAGHAGLPSIRKVITAYDRASENQALRENIRVHLKAHYGADFAKTNFVAALASEWVDEEVLLDLAAEIPGMERPSPEQIARADAAVRQVAAAQSLLTDTFWIGVAIFWSLLAIGAVIGLSCALVFKRNLVLSLFGIAVVSRETGVASGLKLSFRTFLVWGAGLAGAAPAVLVWLSTLPENPGMKPFALICLGLYFVFIGVAVARTVLGKGWQDRFAGTTVVPI